MKMNLTLKTYLPSAYTLMGAALICSSLPTVAESLSEAIADSSISEYVMTENYEGYVGQLKSRTFSIDGDGNSILGPGTKSYAFYLYGTSASATLELSNLTISGYGSATYGFNGIISLDNVTLTGNASTSSTSAGFNGGFTSIIDSTFTNNSTVYDSGDITGGAINAAGVTYYTTIENCYFEENSLSSTDNQALGGAIYIRTSNADVSDGISDNIINGTFINNSVTSGDNALGGAICVQGGEFTEISGYFEGNSATATTNFSADADGGAISTTGWNATAITSISADFVGNYVTSTVATYYDISGGAIFIGSDGSYETGSIGGTEDDYALYEGNYVKQDIDATDANSSYANANGGAIRNDATVISLIQYCDFIGNYVESPGSAYGGAISNYYSYSMGIYYTSIDTIADVNFIGNKAIASNEINGDHGYGGAIYNNLYINQIIRTVFDSNEATHGGAIYNDGYIYLENAYFTNNTASVAGGAIYNSSYGYLEIYDDDSSTTFSGNTANGVANAIHNEGIMYLYVVDSNIVTFNETLTGSGSLYINDYLGEGSPTSNGTVTLNADMSNYTGAVTIHNGTIVIGEDMLSSISEGSEQAYTNFFSGQVTFGDSAEGTTVSLDASNEVLDYFNTSEWSTDGVLDASIDVSLLTQSADFFDLTGDELTINISELNIVDEALVTEIKIAVANANEGFSLSADQYEIVTDNYTYTITDEYMDGTYYLIMSSTENIPEPSTATLSLLALAALCARRRRKTQA